MTQQITFSQVLELIEDAGPLMIDDDHLIYAGDVEEDSFTLRLETDSEDITFSERYNGTVEVKDGALFVKSDDCQMYKISSLTTTPFVIGD